MVGAYLLPVFKEWVTLARNLIVENRELIKTRVEQAVDLLATGLRVAWNVGKSFYDTFIKITDMLGGLDNILKVVGVALLAVGSVAILSAIGTAAMAIGGVVAALLALNGAAIAAGVSMVAAWVAAALPAVLIGALIVGLGLVIEDLYTYMTGGESVFGDWVKWFNDAVDKGIELAKEFGGYLYDHLIQPLIDAWEWMKKLGGEIMNSPLKTIAGIFGIDVGADTEKNGAGSNAVASGGFNPGLPIGGGGAISMGIGASPLMIPASSPAVTSSMMDSSTNMSVSNNYTINANGLNEDQARSVVSEEVARHQQDLFRRAGQNSARKNRE